MRTLIVGFDSAWTRTKKGALVAASNTAGNRFSAIGEPEAANFDRAELMILDWQEHIQPDRTLILVDQPLVVRNEIGQRPVENLMGSPVSRRFGGVQPASLKKRDMFGPAAPVRAFLHTFSGPTDPLEPKGNIHIFETYPVLALIAKGWTLECERPGGRLPKYNPGRKKTFSLDDWKYVCRKVSRELEDRHLDTLVTWVQRVSAKEGPSKEDQDKLDACLCLLVALWMLEEPGALMVGTMATGYVVVPQGVDLQAELEERCRLTQRDPSEWLRPFQYSL